MASLVQTVRDFWCSITGQQPARESSKPEVVVHDPGAQRPHDLDDPFFDPRVQSRIANIISDNAANKKN
jgi:hypothetical protein